MRTRPVDRVNGRMAPRKRHAATFADLAREISSRWTLTAIIAPQLANGSRLRSSETMIEYPKRSQGRILYSARVVPLLHHKKPRHRGAFSVDEIGINGRDQMAFAIFGQVLLFDRRPRQGIIGVGWTQRSGTGWFALYVDQIVLEDALADHTSAHYCVIPDYQFCHSNRHTPAKR